MTPLAGVDRALVDALEAIGALTSDARLDPAWFADPMARVSEVLERPDRRAALERCLGRLRPAAAGVSPAGEHWHPLLNLPTGGDLYLTIEPAADGRSSVWGAAALWRGSTATLPDVSLRARVPLVQVDGEGARPATARPISVEIRIVIPGGGVGGVRLAAARVALSLDVAGTGGLSVVLEGLDPGDGRGVRDVTLDPASVSEETANLLMGLVRAAIALPPATSGSASSAIVEHLLPLLGLADGIPPVPLTELARGSAALRGWLRTLLAEGSSARWLGHAGGMTTGETRPVEGSGTPEDPWKVPIASIAGGSRLFLTLARKGEAVHFGVRLRLAPDGADPAIVLDAAAVLIEIPLGATAEMRVLPGYEILLRAPGAETAWLAGGASSPFAVRSLLCGLRGAPAQEPVLELRGVRIDGTEHARLDLSSANAIADAGSTLLRDALVAALGPSDTARHLLALIGLAAPAADPAWPHELDLAAFAARPLAAVGSFHRRALADVAHPWSALLGEIVGLLGLSTPVAGAGRAEDPWHLTIVSADPLTLRLSAWHTAEGETERLRLALEAVVHCAPVFSTCRSELVVIDLAPDGSPEVRLGGAQRVAVAVSPLPRPRPLPGTRIAAQALEASLGWTPGQGIRGQALISDLAITVGADTVSLPALAFPPIGSTDPDTPGSGLGLAPAALDALLLALLTRASISWAGYPGFVATALLGLHKGLAGLPEGWPTLRAASGAASIVDDPGSSLLDWFQRLCSAPASGAPALPAALTWLGGILARELPARLIDPLSSAAAVAGRGTRDSPWTLAVATTGAGLDFWLEPEGPPPAWSAFLGPQIAAAKGTPAVVAAARELARWDGGVDRALGRADPERFPPLLGLLAHLLEQSDGLVPYSSALPSHASWDQGQRLRSAHMDTPRETEAIVQILDRIEALSPPGNRVALLVSPSFGEVRVWDDLLAAAATRGYAVDSGARWDLRAPGLHPLAVPLDSVTAAVDLYVVVLGETADPVARTAQIARVVEKVRALRGGITPVIVGHSTAGLAARAFAAGHPASVRGLITVATPHGGAPLLPLREPHLADTVRVIEGLRPVRSPAGALSRALDLLGRALDGWEQDAADLPPRPHRFPWAEFAGGEGLETGGVPALALASAIEEPLIPALRQALSDRLAARVASPHVAPTHLAVALRTRVPLPEVREGELRVEAAVSTELFRLALATGRPAAEPGRSVAVRLRLSRSGGWLAGSAGARPDPAAAAPESRVRDADLGVRITPDATQVEIALRGAAHRGVPAEVVGLDHPLAEPLLGAVARSFDGAAGAAAALLAEALEALGLAVRGSDGAFAFSIDALAALRLAPGPFLAPRLGAALSRLGGWLGFTGPEQGPWSRPDTLAVLARHPDGSFSVSAAPGGAEGVTLAGSARLALAGTWNHDGRPADLSLTAAVGIAEVTWSTATGTLVFSAGPYLDPLILSPAPDAAVRRRWIAAAIPRLLFSGAASTVIEALFGPGVRIGPLHALLESPARMLAGTSALGDGRGFETGKVRALLEDAAGALGVPIDSGGLSIPGLFRVSLADAPELRFVLSTEAPLGGVADLSLQADIDSALEPALTGRLGLHLELGGGPWGHVDILFEQSPAGLSLVVTPATGTPIRVLPSFGGFGSLAAGLVALLPRALDSLVTELSNGSGPPPLLAIGLEVAEGLGIYDPVGGFSAHAGALAEMAAPGALSRVGLAARGPVVASVARLFEDAASPLAGALPGAFTVEGSLLRWTSPLLSGGAGTVSLLAGWEEAGPRLGMVIEELRPGGAAVLHAAIAHASGSTSLNAALDLDLAPTLGLSLTPRLSLSGTTGAPALVFLPLGAGTESTLAVILAPRPAVNLGPGAARAIAEVAALLAGRALLHVATPDLGQAVFPGGPRVRDLLIDAGLARVTGGGDLIPVPALPQATIALAGLLEAVAAAPGATITLGSSATLAFVDDAGRLGLRLRGHAEGSAGALLVRALFGPREAALADPAAGVSLQLFERGAGDGASVSFSPRLHAVGLGVELSRIGGNPLVSTAVFQLGSAAAIVFFDLAFASAGEAEPFDAGLILGDVSIPLGLARGGQGAGGNPVAASLLRGDGATGDGPGSDPAAAPGVDLLIARRRGETLFRIEGGDQPFWLDVERSFGPLEIRRLGVRPFAGPGLDILIDGGVKVDGLAVQVDDLSVSFPLAEVLNPGAWRLDLAGLALAFSRGGFAVAGGLRKDPGPPVEYNGVLLFQGAGRTITALGVYGRPRDEAGSYTSLFAFVSYPATLGGPPFLFVTGLAAGSGYNRALVLPAAVDDVPDHPLLRALDPGSISSDPMAALVTMRALIPARRGGFWIAAGLRFTSFGLVHSRALVFIALDGGVEIGVLGVSRMILPSADNALVSVELALKARFSAVERILSVQAELTDHSWIFSRDCHLTGGFALFVWFDRGEYVLSLGGYNPYFARPAHYPVVPRLGFRWQASEHAVATGTAYFALTTTCVMAGGSLSIDYRRGGVHAWFTAEADLLIAWDPFAYDFEIAIEVGASYTFEVCFFECWDVTLGFSLGAGLRLMGPPLRGEVRLDLTVTSVTVGWGARSNVPNYLPDWAAFAERYLFAGDPAREGVRALLASGLERTSAGKAIPPGTAAEPWPVGPEASFTVESRMPARRWRLQDAALQSPAEADDLDLAPMGDVPVSASDLTVRLHRREGANWVVVPVDPALLTIEPILGPVPEATWRFCPPREIAAGSNNLTAIVGLRLIAGGIGRGAGVPVAVATIASDDPARARPLPFARRTGVDLDRQRGAGLAAEELASLGAGSPGARALGAAEALLATDPRFGAARAAVGLPAANLSPHARRALARARSAPPFIAPLATGLSMRAVGLPPALPRPPVRDARPVSLETPRLRALLRPAAAPISEPRPIRTTVNAPGVLRAAPPAPPAVPGAELLRLASRSAPRETRAARGGLRLMNPESGSGAGPAEARVLAALEKAMLDEGTLIAGGVTEVWDLPSGAGASLSVRGSSGLRVTSLARGGAVLADVELPPSSDWTGYDLPSSATRIALTALGDPPPDARPSRSGRRLAVAGRARPVSGFTAALEGVRIGDRTILLPGAVLRLPLAAADGPAESVVSLAAVLAGVTAIETHLPVATRVIAVMLDEVDVTAASNGDLVVSVRGAGVGRPVVETAGRRRALVYPVESRVEDAATIAVAVGSRQGLRVAAVLGMDGTAPDAASWLRRSALEVPPIGGWTAVAGEVRARFASRDRAPTG